jgi:hypothetical protein
MSGAGLGELEWQSLEMLNPTIMPMGNGGMVDIFQQVKKIKKWEYCAA